MGFMSAMIGGGMGVGIQMFSNYASKIPISRSEFFKVGSGCQPHYFIRQQSFLLTHLALFFLLPLIFRALDARFSFLRWMLRG